MNAKTKILTHRLISSALLLVTVIVSICLWNNNDIIFDSVFLVCLLAFADLAIPIIWIGSFLLSCKTYEYNGMCIIVYAGWYHHYIEVNGKKTDEHNTLLSYTPITLSCVLVGNTQLDAVISLTNRISLKINGLLYQPIN